MGGLGNQLFQYAYGRALALSHNCALKLDLSFYDSQDFRAYGLSYFSIAATIAQAKEVEDFKRRGTSGIKLWKGLFGSDRPGIIREQSLKFDPANLITPLDVYAEGYWQSEAYFKDHRNQIVHDLTITAPPGPKNQDVLRLIGSCNAVSLHIRRGDYVLDTKINSIHGTCALPYYEKAVRLVSAKIQEPVFFVFSDDIAWARANLRIDAPVHFIDINNAQNAHEDLRLMTACQHQIIANSTLSWWAAWLNPDPRKNVIAPRIWFTDSTLNKLSTSLVPEDWIRI